MAIVIFVKCGSPRNIKKQKQLNKNKLFTHLVPSYIYDANYRTTFALMTSKEKYIRCLYQRCEAGLH